MAKNDCLKNSKSKNMIHHNNSPPTAFPVSPLVRILAYHPHSCWPACAASAPPSPFRPNSRSVSVCTAQRNARNHPGATRKGAP